MNKFKGELEQNLRVYSDPKVVHFYEKLTNLQPCEKYVFDKYVRPGSSILDLGVGGGRTTPYLSTRASCYVGVDYSEEMIKLCRNKFPHFTFHCINAASMPVFTDSSFDTIVFSFNGIDYLYPDSRRIECLKECARILKKDGLLIFSSHNASVCLVLPVLTGVSLTKQCWRLLRASAKSIQLASKAFYSKVFWSGKGYVTDPTHGGLKTHQTTPQRLRPELEAAGFKSLECVSGNYPARDIPQAISWYYYVCQKSDLTESGENTQ